MITLLAATTFITTWYGPGFVSFPSGHKGNPYDPAENDAWVELKGPGGVTEQRLAFFDERKWKARITVRKPGLYDVTLNLNGKRLETERILIRDPLKDGYVRRGGQWGFQFDSGKRYWPLGHNLGWQPASGFPDLTEYLATMGENGVNWTRIWACTWDGKNPWWPNGDVKIPIGSLWPKALARWDDLVVAADKAGVPFQFVLFHHGQWSTTTDANWNDNPWNTAKGGFLANPADFFSNERAKKLSKIWIRYAIARWGYSPAVMAWELFNEVQWVDAVRKVNRSAEVGKWHDEMARYIRSLDPSKHLVVTSSEVDLPIWREMDSIQPHGYPARVSAMVLDAKAPDKRPFFFAEVGPGELMGGKETQVRAVRDGIWSGLFALQAGAAQYWTWDLMPRYGLMNDYKHASRILAESKILDETELKTIIPGLGVKANADLAFSPGAGWAATRQYEFQLPQDGLTKMGRLSSFFQGKAHPEFRTKPVVFRFTAEQPGTLTIQVVGVSATGGELAIKVNGAPAYQNAWAGGTKFTAPEIAKAEFSAGGVVVELNNAGPDWVQLGRITVPRIAPEASAVGVGNTRTVLMRVERAQWEGSSALKLSGLPLTDGRYIATSVDLNTGIQKTTPVQLKAGNADRPISVAAQDSIFWLRGSR